jgi:hypothetical protein
MKVYMDVTGGIEENMLFKAQSAGQAKRKIADEYGEDFTSIRVRRVHCLDRYDDVDSPDAEMALLRNGWNFTADCFVGPEWDIVAPLFEKTDVVNSDTMRSEADYELFAKAIGAQYPDRYKPKEDA